MIRILMADDHVMLRESLKHVFECIEDIQIGAEASDGDEVLNILKEQSFDLILLDVKLPGVHGEELIDKIRKSKNAAPILILSMHNEPQIAKLMLHAGASGYITKKNSTNQLLEAIRIIASGGRFIASQIAEEIFFNSSSKVSVAPHELLSPRELIILRLLAQGNSVNQIADSLHLSNKTVSAHKNRLMEKMHIDSFADLVKYTIAHGLTV